MVSIVSKIQLFVKTGNICKGFADHGNKGLHRGGMQVVIDNFLAVDNKEIIIDDTTLRVLRIKLLTTKSEQSSR